MKVHISHLKPTERGQHEEIFELLDRGSRDVDVTFDAYPYLSGSTMLNFLLPYEVWDDGPLAVLNRLGCPEIRRRFAEGLETYRAQFPTARIAWVLSADNKRYQGMTLDHFLNRHRGSAADVLCDLLIEERLAVLLVIGGAEDEIVEPMLQHQRYMMGSDGIYHPDGAVHPRVFGSAPRVLGQLVRERKLFSLEEAVYKLAAFPAARYGLTDRGTLAPGQFADVVVLDADRIGDRTTPEDPRAASGGVEQLWINGQRVWSESESRHPITKQTPGRWLRYRA